jgi:hypothetical protein
MVEEPTRRAATKSDEAVPESSDHGYIPAEAKLSVPLAHVARYQALTARLFQQMRALALK